MEQTLCKAIQDGKSIEEIKRYLNEGADPDGDGLYYVPLVESIKAKRTDVTRLIVDVGADPMSMIDDVMDLALQVHIPSMWIMLEVVWPRTRGRMFGRLCMIVTNSRRPETVRKWIELMVQFVEKGYIPSGSYSRTNSTPDYLPEWKDLPDTVRECYVANMSHYVGNDGCFDTIAQIYGPVYMLAVMRASTRFMDTAVRHSRKGITALAVNWLKNMFYSTMQSDEDLYDTRYKRYVDMVNLPWAPKYHDLFSPEFKKTVMTTMLVWTRDGAGGDPKEGRPPLPLEMWWFILRWTPRF
jgi:hypothetical protein